MRKSRFTEAQIIGMIKEQEAGLPTSELCRKHGLSPATFYKLLADASADVSPLEDAATKRGLPLSILRHDDAKARNIYEAKLVLVRPDTHVAWRGNASPDPAASSALLDKLTGWSSSSER